MAKKVTSLQVKVLGFSFTFLLPEINEIYLSKVTSYFYFVTLQHC